MIGNTSVGSYSTRATTAVRKHNVKFVAGPASEKPDDVRTLAALAQSGELKPVIDRRYPFERMLDAHRYVDEGHKAGSVVVTL